MTDGTGRREAAGLMGLTAFAKAVHSIRTRYALVTGFFLLLFLAVFYVGGRFVLSNLIADTERQVREAGRQMTATIRQKAEEMREAAAGVLEKPGAATADVRALLADFGVPFSFVARFSPDGRFLEGVRRGIADGRPVPFPPDAFAPYNAALKAWIQATGAKAAAADDGSAVGAMHLGTRLHGVTLLPRGGAFLLFGLPLSPDAFARRDKGAGAYANLNVRVFGAIKAGSHADGPLSRSAARSRHGIAPLFTESLDDVASGVSFWKFRHGPLDAVLVLRDISGNAVSAVSVSLPKVFFGATRMAIWQLAFCVALGGILFVLPIFWVQGRLLLNPLTRMTRMIADLGARAPGLDCPRIAWEGKDEFALLAESVNRLVETIAAKTVALANVEASHQALIAGVPDALVVFDAQGRMVSVSKQAESVPPLPGFAEGAPPSADVFGAAGAAAFARALTETSRAGTVGRLRLAAAGAPTRHFEVRLTRMGARFVLAIVRDITAELAEHARRLAAEARALNASKRESLTRLAAGIAHDMNNVLSVVLNAAEGAAADPTADTAPALGTIRDAVRRGSSMMHELMTFAGESRMTLMRANPKMVLEDARQLVSRVVGDRVAVAFEARGDVPDVDVDLNQFWKVFFNIVKNAGEAMGGNAGHVTLAVAPFRMTKEAASAFVSEHPLPEGDGVLFRVTDDGPGIPERIRSRIFDPYVSSKSLGRGLGLATVRAIVEAHGGGIAVESRPDCGTTFRIYLPVSRLAPAAEAAADVPEAAALTGEVLIVDDDEAILKTTRILCQALKLAPHVARDRREALAVVRRHASRLRAIVLDAHLGQVDTVRLLGAFRLGAPHVPVILASGSAPEAVEKMFRAHPYDVFLPKPYTLAELKGAFLAAATAQDPVAAQDP